VKKLFRKIKKKLSPLLLIPIVLLVLVLGGGYLLFFSGDDDDDSSNVANGPVGTVETEPRTTPTTPTTPEKDPAAKPPPPKGKQFLIDSDREEKDYALAQAIGTVQDPDNTALTMRIGAAPKQPVTVEINYTCTLPDERAKSVLNSSTITPPASLQLKVPINGAAKCEVSAQARLTRAGKGRVKVFLTGIRSAGA